MEVFAHAATQMIILSLLIIAGVVARKCKLMNDDFDSKLSQLVMNISLPAMIISSVLNSENLPSASTIGWILVLSFFAYAIALAIAWFIPRLYPKATPKERGAHSFIIAFGNVGFIGFPVLSAIFGPNAVLYASIFNIIYNLAAFSIGVMFIKSGSETKDIQIGAGSASIKGKLSRVWHSLCNPGMAACVIAPILACFGITDNGGVIGQTVQVLGQLTVPASMLVIGSSLAKMSVKDMLCRVSPYITSLFRLLVVPIVIFLIFRLFVSDSMILGVLVVGTSMPAASLATMFAIIYGGDVSTVMRCTFISTILSLITIPLLAMLVC